MIIYIHGFGGNGLGSKASVFREYFKDDDFIAPSLSYIPNLALQTLEELILSYKGDVQLIGSSLGGYFSIYLAKKYNLKAVLINPSIFPYKTLYRSLGNVDSFYDDSSFAWLSSHIDSLKQYKTNIKTPSDFMLLVQKEDEVIDFKEAVKKLNGASIFIEEGGNHSFVNIENHFDSIRSFLL